MKREFREYQKSKEFLICVDSDGSAMNTMEIKHKECFCPCLIAEWGLEPFQEPVMRIWNYVNLYSITRGINRFQALQIVMKHINDKLTPIADIASLDKWLASTKEMSNAALIRYLEDVNSPFLTKALHWSQSVSRDIGQIPVEKRRPYDGVADALQAAREKSDIVVVSAANPDAMYEEWELNGCGYYVNMILNQNIGTKEFCVSEMVKKGYAPDHVIMIGDAMEDLEVAKACGVCFYPIILQKEEHAWRMFEIEALERFYNGTYKGAYEEQLITEFGQAFKTECE